MDESLHDFEDWAIEKAKARRREAEVMIILAITRDIYDLAKARYGEDFLELWSHGESFNVIVLQSMKFAEVKAFNEDEVAKLFAMLAEVLR